MVIGDNQFTLLFRGQYFKSILKTIILFLTIALFGTNVQSQVVPFYPIELFFCPVGYTNNIPGNPIGNYNTFSSFKMVLNKDLPAPERFSNTISIVSNIIKYHDVTKAVDYHPFALSPILTTHFFATDIFTLGMDVVGDVEFLPGTNSGGSTFSYQNYRFRLRPFHYLIVTPSLIAQQVFTYGRSFNSDESARLNSDDQLELISNDYTIMKYQLKSIYFTKFHTRIFLIPYFFITQYHDIAINKQKKIDRSLQKLREEGYGLTFGMRYMTFTWGFAEGSFEVERNVDKATGGNTYTKIKLNAKWENQYFTERFGYLFSFDFIRHISDDNLLDLKNQFDGDPQLGRIELRGDIMPIFNVNRNVSIRPEFDIIYRDFTDRPSVTKYRYWLHLHVLL